MKKRRPLREARYSFRVRQEGAGHRGRRGNSLHSQWVPEQRFRVDILIPVIPSSSSPSTYCLSSDFLPVPLAWPPPHPACFGHVAQRASSSPTVWGPGLSRGHLGNRWVENLVIQTRDQSREAVQGVLCSLPDYMHEHACTGTHTCTHIHAQTQLYIDTETRPCEDTLQTQQCENTETHKL